MKIGITERGVVAFWDGQSKGTAHNFELAIKYNTPIKIYNYLTVNIFPIPFRGFHSHNRLYPFKLAYSVSNNYCRLT
jgi:hypothetical protein